MREEEAWRHIQEQDVDNEEEEDGETIPTSRLELSRKRPQEFTDEQKENKDDQRRPTRTRRLEKGPSQPTESQQESASNCKGSRKRSHMDTAETEDTHNLQHYVEDHPPFTRPKISVETALDAVADESQETDRLLVPFENRGTRTSRRCRRPLDKGKRRGDQMIRSMRTLRRRRAELREQVPRTTPRGK